MSLIRKKGNLLDMAERGEFDIIVHGANCICVMGSGIAREIKARFPQAAQADAATAAHDYGKLGTYTEAQCGGVDGHEFTIINAYTQFKPASHHTHDVFEYLSFEMILQKLVYAISHHAVSDVRVGFPYIGMGLANGDAMTIIESIKSFAVKISALGGTVTMVEFER